MALRVLELFGGIGACTCALKRMGIPIEIVDYVEIDRFAVSSYNAINDTNFTPQDVRTWDKDVQVDFLLHGSPCQDFSLAGLQKGGDKGSGTRSSLMYETLRIVNKLKPKYVIWENVANLLSEKHFHNFANYLNAMAEFGYASAYKLLNAKDYGIPQNRERVFVVSVLDGISCDLLGEELLFEFPKPIPLKLRLRDMLEENVDEKYYLSQKGIDYILNDERIGGGYTNVNPSIAIPVTAKGQTNWTGSFIEPTQSLSMSRTSISAKTDALEQSLLTDHRQSTITEFSRGGYKSEDR